MKTPTPSVDWRCRLCGHFELTGGMKCASCGYLRVGIGSIDPIATLESPLPRIEKEPLSLPKAEVLERALEGLNSLFERAQRERREMTPEELSSVYESLLTSFLRIEREQLRQKVYRESSAELKRQHMKHLSLIWFLGICTGLALSYALQTIS
jgi:hypothetical protein